MSVYNAEKYLREAIESILNQTFTDFEFLIINDCSTDTSRTIIVSYTDNRIKLIDNEINIGLTKSLNKGIDLAQGKYIARIDADDISLPKRLLKQVDFLDKNTEYVAVGSEAISIDEYGNEINTWNCGCNFEQFYVNLFFGNTIPHSSVLIRSQIIKEFKYNENFKYAQDYELWQRIAYQYKMTNLREVHICYRTYNWNISAKNKEAQDNFAIQVNEMQLHNLGINHITKNQLLFHFKLIRYNIPTDTDVKNKIEILNWLLMLCGKNKVFKVYHEFYFTKKLEYFWGQYFSFENSSQWGAKAIKYINAPFHKQINIRVKISFFIKCILSSLFNFLPFIKRKYSV